MILNYMKQFSPFYGFISPYKILPAPLYPTRYVLYSKKYISSKSTSASLSSRNDMQIEKSPDSVIAKYEKLLDEMNTSHDPQLHDAIYKTNFGFIRFDSDNNIIKQKKDTKDPYLKGEMNYIDEVYFQESRSNVNPIESPNLLNSELSSSMETMKPTDLNFVDSQYLTVYSSSSHNNQHYKSTEDLRPSNLNYIDSQYIYKGEDAFPQDGKSPNFETLNSSLSSPENQCQETTEHFFSFEDSLQIDSEKEPIMLERNLSNKVSQNLSNPPVDREALENQLLDLSNESSAILLKNNPKIKAQILRRENRKELSESDDGQSNEKELRQSNEKEPRQSKQEEMMHNHASSLPDENKLDNTGSKELSTTTQSALSYVMQKRRDEKLSAIKEIEGGILPHEKYKKVLLHIPRFSDVTQTDIVNILKRSVVYNDNGIVAISKQYGIPIHEGSGHIKKNRLNITSHLPFLAEKMKKENLFPVHRLDMNTTGVLVFADNEHTANELKKMFKERLIKKTYLAITKGIPEILNGVIDIPIAEGKVGEFYRMTLSVDAPGFKNLPKKSKKAITRYKVLSRANGCSLLELNPITGVKHQLRVHLGFGLNCPVLGDHKFSNLSGMIPQKLPGDALQKFGLQQSSVRHLPLHLHAFSISIPNLGKDGRELFIKTGPPRFFKISLSLLNLSSRNNRLSNDYSEIIFGYE